MKSFLRYIPISWNDNEQECSCGWLLSEFIRRFRIRQSHCDRVPAVVALATFAGNNALDYWLNCYERSLQPVPDGLELMAVLYHKIRGISKDPKMSDFTVLKSTLGLGGFSSVKLGNSFN